MAAIFDFRALNQVHITLKPVVQMQWKRHTHKININEETDTSVIFSFVE